jgi:hypothetical protein
MNTNKWTSKDWIRLVCGYIGLAATWPLPGSLGKDECGPRTPKYYGKMMPAVIALGHQCRTLRQATPALKNQPVVDHIVTFGR